MWSRGSLCASGGLGVGGVGSLGPPKWCLGVVRCRGRWAVGVVLAAGLVPVGGPRFGVVCRSVFGWRSGGVRVSFECRGAVVGGRWSVVVGWLVVVVGCAGVVTLCHAVVILLLWEFMLVSNKVSKRTIDFIGSVAELLSLLFCASGDPEVKSSIPHVCII